MKNADDSLPFKHMKECSPGTGSPWVTRPASTVQQTAYHQAMDEHLPRDMRHRFASYADDLACGADTLEELFEMYKALIICLSKAGIQVKASKVRL